MFIVLLVFTGLYISKVFVGYKRNKFQKKKIFVLGKNNLHMLYYALWIIQAQFFPKIFLRLFIWMVNKKYAWHNLYNYRLFPWKKLILGDKCTQVCYECICMYACDNPGGASGRTGGVSAVAWRLSSTTSMLCSTTEIFWTTPRRLASNHVDVCLSYIATIGLCLRYFSCESHMTLRNNLSGRNWNISQNGTSAGVVLRKIMFALLFFGFWEVKRGKDGRRLARQDRASTSGKSVCAKPTWLRIRPTRFAIKHDERLNASQSGACHKMGKIRRGKCAHAEPNASHQHLRARRPSQPIEMSVKTEKGREDKAYKERAMLRFSKRRNL